MCCKFVFADLVDAWREIFVATQMWLCFLTWVRISRLVQKAWNEIFASGCTADNCLPKKMHYMESFSDHRICAALVLDSNIFSNQPHTKINIFITIIIILVTIINLGASHHSKLILLAQRKPRNSRLKFRCDGKDKVPDLHFAIKFIDGGKAVKFKL